MQKYTRIKPASVKFGNVDIRWKGMFRSRDRRLVNLIPTITTIMDGRL